MPRSHSVRRGRRAPPCGSVRWHASPSSGRGSHDRGWPHAKRDRDRGRCPRSLELVEPRSTALWRRRLLSVSLCASATRRIQACERALDLGDYSSRHAGIASRRLELVMSKQRLNQAYVLASLEQMGREGMAKRMKRERLAQSGGFHGFLEKPAKLACGQWLMTVAAGKQPTLFRLNADVIPSRPRLPPLPQQVEGLGRQHYVPVLVALRLHDADDHLRTVDVACPQPHHLAGPQPAAIRDGQHHLRLQARRHGKNTLDLLGAQHRRQLLRLLEVPHLSRQIVATQRNAEQEPHPGHDSIAITDARTTLDQVELKKTHLVGCCGIRRAFEPGGKPLAALDVAALRMGIELARSHVFDHTLTQRTDGIGLAHGSSFLSEVREHLDSQDGALHRAIAILSACYGFAAHGPAQRAGAQRLCALARLSRFWHCSKSSAIRVDLSRCQHHHEGSP